MGAAEQPWPEVMDLLTAASYLHIHPVTLREWKRKQQGPPGRKMGGRWRFHKPALDAYLSGTKQPKWQEAPTHLFPEAKKARSISVTPTPADSEYLRALGLPTVPSRLSGQAKSTPKRSG